MLEKNEAGEEKDDGEEMIQKITIVKARGTCNVQERECRRWAVLGTEYSTEAWA